MEMFEVFSQKVKWAKYLLSIGFKAMPVHGINESGLCTCNKTNCNSPGKHPIRKKWSKEGEGCFKSIDEIDEFYRNHPMANYAILTTEIAVLDIDSKNGGVENYREFIEPNLIEVNTFSIKSGSGNGSRHLYFKNLNEEFKNATCILPGIDLRGAGGYIVGPGCLHVSGGHYEVISTGSKDGSSVQITLMPDKLRSFLKSDKSLQKSQDKSSEIKANIVFGGLVKEGQRNSTLISYAGTLLQKKLTEIEIKDLLLVYNSRFEKPLDANEVLQICKSIMRYKTDEFPNSPLPLFRDSGQVPEFPIKALGSKLCPVAEVLSQTIQAPKALIGQSLLGAAALAAQSYIDVAINERVIPTSIFLLSVGTSGERKSAVDKQVLYPHREIEKQNIEQYKLKMNEFKIKDIQYKRSLTSNGKNKKENPMSISNVQAPLEPFSEIMLMQEPTFEGLINTYTKGRASVGLFSDEGGQFLGGYSMNKDNIQKTITGISNLWDANPITRTRASEGSSKIYGKRLSMHLMVQPHIFFNLTSNELVSDQGLLSRCLVAFPESNIGKRAFNNFDLNTSPDVQSYRSLMRDLLSKALPYIGDTNELQTKKINLSREAFELWINYHDKIELNMKDTQPYSTIKGFASKAAEHALRIAGVLYFINTPNSLDISKGILSNAIEITDFYLLEALRLYNSSIINPDLKLAQKLLDWCQQYNEVHIQQIYNYGPNSIRSKEVAEKAIKVLENHGWLKPIEGGKKIDGSHRKKVWEVIRETK